MFRETGSSLESSWGASCGSLSPKGEPGPNLAAEDGDACREGSPGLLRVGRRPWGLPAFTVSPSGPRTLVYPHSHQNDEKEKLRIEKGPRRTEPLSWEPPQELIPRPTP